MTFARRLVPVIVLVGSAVVVPTAHAHASVSHQQIEGSGSSWATNALNVWIANVTSAGLRVVFTSTGSAVGRRDFGNQVTDFAVSDVGYQGTDPQTGGSDVPCKLGELDECRAYAYLPIVAGGLSFPYHLEVGGQLVRDVRLSGATLAKIFTGAITNWADPAIRSDNHGRRLPSLPIIPVSHSEGSGASSQFSAYLDDEYPSIYRPFAGGPGATLYMKSPPNGSSQTGSDGVMNFVASAHANGAIGYDEYSYALAKNYPVAKVANASRHYTLPTQYDVAVALRHATVDSDTASPSYGLANLTAVYDAPEPTAYPLSAYAYMIIPTAADDSRMNTAKRQTLADFITYSVCDGQSQVGTIGYAPLPLGLTTEAFNVIQLLKAADPDVDLTNRDTTPCNNPTFRHGDPPVDTMDPAPPPLCDTQGWGPCGDAGDDSDFGGVRISINRSTNINYGGSIAISCVLRSGTGTVADQLRIERKRVTATSWRTVATRSTRSDGTARISVRPAASTSYRCVNPRTAITSSATTIGVRKVVTTHAHSAHARIRVDGQVRPGTPGQMVQVQERVRGRWITITHTPQCKGGYTYAFTTRRSGKVLIRAVCGASAGTLAGTSRTVAVTVR